MTGLRVPPSAAAPAPPRRPGRAAAATGWLRWGWRQLTSMRTALVLLFLLAIAAVPGSMLPQQGINPQGVQQYYQAHPSLAPLLARLSLFNVFAAPWFAAIYLLLFASLAGCVIPRTFRLAGSARQPPPRAPGMLSRLPLTASYQTRLPPAAALADASRLLAGKRFRLRTGDGWVSAEKGYLREAGNLLFHLALLGVLVAVAAGGMFGYKANRLLVEGDSFANTITDLDAFHPGRAVSADSLQPFSITLDRFRASYISSGAQRGQPSGFNGYIRYSPQPGDPSRRYDLRVNHPLGVDGVRVFMIGHGYAPVFRVTDGTGRVVFDGPVPFIAVDSAGFTSEGVIKVPDARPRQLGFAGVFLPTAVDIGGRLRSAFPAPDNPAVSLVSYTGNLGMNSGPAQSVYTLDTAGLRRLPVSPRPLAPGQAMKLPGGNGTLTFTGYRQWMSLAITYDPGTVPALIAGSAALAGLLLSFFVRRRRVFVRARPGPDGRTAVELGGLARTDAAGSFETEFAALAAELESQTEGE
ncbi:MAG: cytochrome c biogenesis protein ResB [Nocardiopsaceae bacterium]|nr:cytochrome c biogenesis protein ResB [Nocardiopsaceae bacterium]